MIHSDKIRKNGFDYIKIRVGERSCIYAQLYEEKPIGFEVFIIKVQKESERFGKTFPAKFRFPGNEDFGKWAWSYRSLELAENKFNELEHK